MKAKRLLAILLTLCMVFSAVPVATMSVVAAGTATLGEGRLTHYDSLLDKVDLNSVHAQFGENEKDGTSGDGPANIFDADFNTKYGVGGNPSEGTPIDITFKTTEPVTITSYTLGTGNDDSIYKNRQPKSWKLYGSETEGEGWVELSSVSDYPVLNVSKVYFDDDFRVSEPAAYTYYKLTITASGNDGYFQFGELAISGYDYSAVTSVEALIAALPDTIGETDVAAVEAAREAINALGALAESVNNLDKFIAAEAQAAVLGAEDKEKATAAVFAINAIGTVTYKSNNAITIAEAAWAELNAADKECLDSYGITLTNARSAFQTIMDEYDWNASESRPNISDRITKNAWAADCSEEAWQATRAAFKDAVNYQYYKGRKIDGDLTANYDTWMTDNNGFWNVPVDNSDDNYDKQEFKNRFTTLTAPFAGIAFSVDSALAQGWQFESSLAIGEYFHMNDGRTYQVMWDRVKSYETTEPSSSADAPAVTTTNNHPEERASDTETNKNIFRYAYAKYSSDNRWDGLTLGIPQGEWATTNGDARYQHFVGPQGNAYIFTTLDQISAAPETSAANQDSYAANMANSYAVVTGILAENFYAATPEEIAARGAIVSATSTEIEFELGVLTEDGFMETDEQAATRVQLVIDALPAAADVQAFHKSQIEIARRFYDEIVETAQAMVNTEKLEAAETAINEILTNDPQGAIDLVNYIYNNLTNVTYKSLNLIQSAQAAYDELSEDAQARVTNYARIAAATEEFNAIIDAYNWNFTENRPSFNETDRPRITRNGWALTCSEEAWQATRAAINDAVKYQYYKGRKIDGDLSSGTDIWMTVDQGFWHVPMDNSDDNYNNQDWRNRFTSLTAPFAGMAFSIDTTFAQRYGFAEAYAVGEYFKMNDGKTYQVMWNATKSYDSVEPSSSATAPAVTSSNAHPEERASDADTNKNIFRYAYAKYSNDNRWDGLTLGIPQSEWAVAAGEITRYQEFFGPQGNSVIFTTTEMIAAAPETSAADQDSYATDMANAYYLVTGALADVFADADTIDKASIGDLTSVAADEIEFEYGVLTADGLVVADADYSVVEEAIASIPADLDGDVYTASSVQAVKDAVDAVEYGLKAIDQAKVDAFAAAITSAINKLIPKSADFGIDISNGMVTEGENGRLNITWNATITFGDGTTVDSINNAGILFKSYGVYYATGGEVLADYENASADEIRKKVFDQGEDIDLYTSFGFRLKGVTEDMTRAAMFYIEYEIAGNTIIILSTVDETIAVIVE